MPKPVSPVPVESITSRIILVRSHKVMLDSDLAELYGVSTSAFNQGVRRNIDRFPSDCMFQLTDSDFSNLKSQFVTSRWGSTTKQSSNGSKPSGS